MQNFNRKCGRAKIWCFKILQNSLHQILSKSVPTLVQLRLNFPIRVVSAHCGLFWGICGRCGGPDVSAIVINCELLTHMAFVVGVVRIYHKATVKTQTTIWALLKNINFPKTLNTITDGWYWDWSNTYLSAKRVHVIFWVLDMYTLE